MQTKKALVMGLKLRSNELNDRFKEEAVLDAAGLVITLSAARSFAKNMAKNAVLSKDTRAVALATAGKIGLILESPKYRKIEAQFLEREGDILSGGLADLIRNIAAVPAEQAADTIDAVNEHFRKCLKQADLEE